MPEIEQAVGGRNWRLPTAVVSLARILFDEIGGRGSAAALRLKRLPFGTQDAHNHVVRIAAVHISMLAQAPFFDEAAGPVGADGALIGGAGGQTDAAVVLAAEATVGQG